MRTCTIVITEEPDGSAYNVSVPVLKGCFTYDSTWIEAIEHAHDAVRVYVESLVGSSEPFPDDARTLIASVQVEIPETVKDQSSGSG